MTPKKKNQPKSKSHTNYSPTKAYGKKGGAKPWQVPLKVVPARRVCISDAKHKVGEVLRKVLLKLVLRLPVDLTLQNGPVSQV